MTKEEYRQMCQSHGLTMVSDIRAVGWEGGYFAVVQYAGKNNISVSLPTRKDDRKQYADGLKSELKARLGKDGSAAWGENCLTIFVSSKNNPDVYRQGVVVALDALRGLGFTVPDTCRVCGRSSCDAAIPQEAAYIPVHRSCLEGAVSGAQDKSDANKASGSYLLGFIGAFLGMVLGILPTLFTIISMERIYVLLFTLIPLASYAGYRLFKGRMNYAALVLSILFSVVGVFALNFISDLWAVKEYYELTFSEMLELAGPAVTDLEVWKEILQTGDFLKCLLFVALGIFLAWGQISQTSKTAVKNAQGVLSSAVPYAPQGFAADPAPDADPETETGSQEEQI